MILGDDFGHLDVSEHVNGPTSLCYRPWDGWYPGYGLCLKNVFNMPLANLFNLAVEHHNVYCGKPIDKPLTSLVEIAFLCQDAWGVTLAAEFEEAQLQGTDEAWEWQTDAAAEDLTRLL